MTTPAIKAPAHTNRLAREKSPYLLQHAHNPVDWFPWSEEAFEKARRENKPVFLSIGYSTCHWCHVMERESFENERVGEFLNAHFVSIKVDREERPDVDRIYMTFVQATTGSGGWPMSVFLTPDRKPFFGGTYFPPDNRHGRAGFLQLLERIHQLWETRRDELVASADDAHVKLGQFASLARPDRELPPAADVLREAGLLFKSHYDPRNGGFGRAPKFPQPSQPQFLLRYARRFQDEDAVQMVLHTCHRMAAGGINDQLGGGFSRYSVDAEWLVPHFEKMLYDNAQLVHLYLDAHLLLQSRHGRQDKESGSDPERFASVARDILQYVRRDMTHPEGGFFSAEDADSEGHEGKFYCWTREELSKVLAPEEFNVAVRYFGISEDGNFIDHSHPHPLPKQNVLSIVDPNLSQTDRALLTSATGKMIAVRNGRVRPHLDDKILASWNGLMLGAFARAFAILGDESFLETAEKNLAFLERNLWVPAADGGSLYHRWRDGQRDNVQLLDDYAFLLSGVIELYEATLQPAHLEFALELADALIARFHDSAEGGFWQSPAEATDLILRVKEDHDGAEPSGNSVATLALLKLGAISGRKELIDAAEKTLHLMADRLQQAPHALPYLLQALDFSAQEPKRVVITGDPASNEVRTLLHAIHGVYQANKVILGSSGPVDAFSRTLESKGPPCAFICSGQTCQPPVSEAAQAQELMV